MSRESRIPTIVIIKLKLALILKFKVKQTLGKTVCVYGIMISHSQE